jgi:hypothetical protein
MARDNGRHSHAWVLAGECEDTCGCDTICVGVEFGTRCHLVAKV